MIKELRIDNLVLYGAHGPVLVIEVKKTGKVRVEFLSEKSIEHGYYKKTMDISQFDPIPITPEWLERCGFVETKAGFHYCYSRQDTNGCILDFLMLRRHEVSSFYDLGRMNDKYFEIYTQNNHRILHLHQLQNLYFALTGEELQIKP